MYYSSLLPPADVILEGRHPGASATWISREKERRRIQGRAGGTNLVARLEPARTMDKAVQRVWQILIWFWQKAILGIHSRKQDNRRAAGTSVLNDGV